MSKLIGWAPVYAPEPGTIVTQAFILCKNCGTALSPCGGPRPIYCNRCTMEALDDIFDEENHDQFTN